MLLLVYKIAALYYIILKINISFAYLFKKLFKIKKLITIY